jgi:hypothetical protein
MVRKPAFFCARTFLEFTRVLHARSDELAATGWVLWANRKRRAAAQIFLWIVAILQRWICEEVV